MYRILIAGCGYAGTEIALHFVQKKQKVWGLTRSADKAAALQEAGIQPVVADLNRLSSLEGLPEVHFIVIAAAPDTRDETAYRNLYLDGIGSLLGRMRSGLRPRLVVYLSSTGVYGDRKGEWVDEAAPPEPDSERGRILLQAEEQVLLSGLPAVVFRLGGIYGPGRNPVERWVRAVNRKEESDSYVNLIHVRDIAEAMPVIFNRAKTGEAYLGVDDEPALRSTLHQWISRQSGQDFPEPPKPSQAKPRGKRCRNQKLKNLGYAFRYPTFREGLTESSKH